MIWGKPPTTLSLLVSQALRNWSDKALLHLLCDESCFVRTAVARELHMRKTDREIFNGITTMTKDSRHYVREIAAFTLGQLGTPEMVFRQESVPFLMEMLDDSHVTVRVSAIYALGHLFLESEIPGDVESRLIDMTCDKSKHIRESVAFALGYSAPSYCALNALYRLLHDPAREVRSEAALWFAVLEEEAT